jgi:hypothetical protein
MDKTIHKILVVVAILVVFDSTSFSFNVEKHKFGLVSSMVNVYQTGKSVVKAFK